MTIEVEKHLKDGWKLHGGVSMAEEKGLKFVVEEFKIFAYNGEIYAEKVI